MMYLFSFIATIFVVPAVSAIIEEKAPRKETLKMFITTCLGMGTLAIVIFFLSK